MFTRKRSTLPIRTIQFLLLLLPAVFCLSCKKYLDKKSNYQLAIPKNLNDLQLLLDRQVGNKSPGILDLPTDDYYATENSLNAVRPEHRLNYFWDRDAKLINDWAPWSDPYQAVYEANFVLDLLPKVDP
ncbi:MAG TPA: hypothetical protein VHM26_10340, partial [Chitinophagaceae bacterium]|nr:hypothetical protein [Chitinophagaceae bacterium]